MLAELIDKLRGLCSQADGIAVREVDSLPESVFIRQGGEHRIVEVPPARREHRVSDIAAMKEAVSTMSGGNAQVFHGHAVVEVHLDNSDRRDTLRMALHTSAAYKALVGLVDGKRFSPRDVVTFLKYNLAGTGEDTQALIGVLREVKHQTRIDGGGVVQHGRESMGRAVEAEVSNADRIPEYVRVVMSVYRNPDLRAATALSVRVGIILHADTASSRDDLIELRIMGDSLDDAVEDAQKAVGDILCAAMPKVSVVYGCP